MTAAATAKNDTAKEDDDNDVCVIVVARHAERRDYELRDAGGNWVASASRPWDPPLSAHGWSHQSVRLGHHLAHELRRLGLPAISEIYSSPLLRCRQTAAQARNGILRALQEEQSPSDNQNNAEAATGTPSKVRVELGLAESINVLWYRSWALAEADGTWGGPKPPPPQTVEDATTLHPLSLEPVQTLVAMWTSNWNQQEQPNDNEEKNGGMEEEENLKTLKTTTPTTPKLDPTNFDLEYTSGTRIDEPYTYVPRHVETDQEQRRRMRRAVTQLASKPEAKNRTLLFVSHGAPVMHLFEELTGQDRSQHGSSSYCCYSIYKVDRQRLLQSLADDAGATTNADAAENETKDNLVWETVQVNQADFLDEPIVRETHILS